MGAAHSAAILTKIHPLDIKHMISRSRSGKNDIANYQVLCSECNRAKGNKDNTDFKQQVIEQYPSCPFCNPESERVVAENGTVVAIIDKYPFQPTPFSYPLKANDFFTMTSLERKDTEDLLRVVRIKIMQENPSVEGFNLGVNCGEVAGRQLTMRIYI